MPIEEISPIDADLFQSDTLWPYFERLRTEDPVHCNVDEKNSRYWSVTKYDDIVSVDSNADMFASRSRSAVTSVSDDPVIEMKRAALIINDAPRHTRLRKAVAPSFGARQVETFAPVIRAHVSDLLDRIPVGEEFDWVEVVSAELTNIMFVALFGIPWSDRDKLIRWHDASLTPDPGIGMPQESEEQRRTEFLNCADYFLDLLDRKAGEPAAKDLVSMLAHGLATSDMDRTEYIGHVIGLILGGTHALRGAISGSVFALDQNPQEYDKLIANHNLIPQMISETMRWRTPLGFIQRIAAEDTLLGGKQIAAGERVLMWYVSGNRDADVISDPDRYTIDRERPRQHLSYGFGIHRCLGNRLAELQMRIAWEEILARSMKFEVVGLPVRFRSCFVRDFHTLPVRVTIG